MAVSQPTVKAAILGLFAGMKAGTIDTDDAAADEWATIITDAILSANVTGTATGVTAGGATAPVTGGLS